MLYRFICYSNHFPSAKSSHQVGFAKNLIRNVQCIEVSSYMLENDNITPPTFSMTWMQTSLMFYNFHGTTKHPTKIIIVSLWLSSPTRIIISFSDDVCGGISRAIRWASASRNSSVGENRLVAAAGKVQREGSLTSSAQIFHRSTVAADPCWSTCQWTLWSLRIFFLLFANLGCSKNSFLKKFN